MITNRRRSSILILPDLIPGKPWDQFQPSHEATADKLSFHTFGQQLPREVAPSCFANAFRPASVFASSFAVTSRRDNNGWIPVKSSSWYLVLGIYLEISIPRYIDTDLPPRSKPSSFFEACHACGVMSQRLRGKNNRFHSSYGFPRI